MNIDRIAAVIQAMPVRPHGGEGVLPAVGDLLRLRLAAAQGDDLLLTDGAGFALRLQGMANAQGGLRPGDVLLLRVLSAGPRLELAYVGTAGQGAAPAGAAAPGTEPALRPLTEQAAMRPDQSALRRIALQLPEAAALGEAWYLRALGGGRGPVWPLPPATGGSATGAPVLQPPPPAPAAATPPGGRSAVALPTGEPAAPPASPASPFTADTVPGAAGGATRAEGVGPPSPAAAHEAAVLPSAGDAAGRAAPVVDRLAMPVFAWGGLPAELVLIATAEDAPPPARRRQVLVLRLALKLPLYGRIALQVRWSSAGVQLQLLAARGEVVPALREAVPALAAALAAAGMPLRRCTVHGGLLAEADSGATLPAPHELAARARAMSPGPFRAAAEVVVVLLANALAVEHEALLGAAFGSDGAAGVEAAPGP